MLFNSWEFLIFFPVVLLLYFNCPHKFRWLVLLSASMVFYMAFLPIYVLILVITIIVDYFAGIQIEKARGIRRKSYLILSVIINIGFLCLFKYWDFFAENLSLVLRTHLPRLHDLALTKWILTGNNAANAAINATFGTGFPILRDIVLPIGLSFHTFQALSYNIEVYHGRHPAERHFGIYALYVMFFPQLVAGPIERPQNVLHQFRERKTFQSQLFHSGLRLMLWGLFKKVVIADRAAQYVNLIYDAPGNYHWLNVTIAMVFFSVQIYCDFSGYSDIAIGSARTMGFDLMINFRRPYLATNIRDFWGRWHISLSTWFRDYLYIPLGGSKKGFARFIAATVIVFMVSGLWHGAAWTFIIWGLLHALYQVVFILFNKFTKARWSFEGPVARFLGWGLTMTAVTVAWVFFRARDTAQALGILRSAVSVNSGKPFLLFVSTPNHSIEFGTFSLAVMAICCLYMFYVEYRRSVLLLEYNQKPWRDVLFVSSLICLIVVFGVFTSQSFIYFQF